MTKVLEDAWRTLSPARGDRHGPLPPMLLVLTIVTGLVDAFSYLVLGHVFVANMTGNVVFLAFALAGARGFSIGASLTALAAFSLGAGAGGRLGSRVGSNRGTLLWGCAVAEAVLLCAGFVLTALSSSPGAGVQRYALIVLLASALGTQNSAARRLAVPDLTTTVLTLTLTGLSADSRLAGGAASKLGRRGLSILAMFSGALVGSVLIVHVSKAPVIAIAFAGTASVAALAALFSRRDASWTHA